nr:ADP,ATP carrier protein, mitochondrial-like [Tanacetum cinerariifolium]
TPSGIPLPCDFGGCYKGIGECFGRIIKEEGFVSLSRGNTANVILQRWLLEVVCRKLRIWRQFNGLVDVYKKTLASGVIAGLYCGFNISCAGIIVYRTLYFGMCDSLKPVLLTGKFQVRDELEQLLDDDDDMADLYLSRKLAIFSFTNNWVRLYVNLQELYQAKADFLEVEQCVIDILKKVGKYPYSISKEIIKTFCKNARNLTIQQSPIFLINLGLVASFGPSMSTTSASIVVSQISSGTAKTRDGVQRGGVGVGMGINNNNGGSNAETTAFKNQYRQKGKNMSQQYNHNNICGYSYQRGGGVSPKNKSMGQWSNHRTGFHGRYRFMGTDKSFPPSTKVKQIYVAKQPALGVLSSNMG